jgi:crossover junction endodeoxyribonuclease RusA
MEKSRIYLTLPFPPSVNNLTIVCHGRKILSKRGREYKKLASYEIGKQLSDYRLKNNLKYSEIIIEGHFGYRVDFIPPDKRRRDLDNLLKALLDALVENHVVADDSLCVEGHYYMTPTPKKGGECAMLKIWNVIEQQQRLMMQ